MATKAEMQAQRLAKMTEGTIDQTNLLRGQDNSEIFAQLANINRRGGNADPAELAELKRQLSQAIVKDNGKLTLHRCQASGAGLNIPDDISGDELYSLATDLFILQDGINLWIGDMLVASEHFGYGDIIKIAEEFGILAKTLYNWRSICKSVTISLREEVFAQYLPKKPLSIGHYNLIAGMNYKEQSHWMHQCYQHGWSVSKLREAIRETKSKPVVTAWDRFEQRVFALVKTEDKHTVATRLRMLADAIESD